MSLVARFALTRDAFELDVELEVASGETLALVGPNGAGKSTCLQALAGLVSVDRGSITLDGKVLDGLDGDGFVPPQERDVGVVFQDQLLFPHLSVLENVAYGLRARGTSRGEARARAAEMLQRVGLSAVGAVRPARLSGGQAQRVALARALAPVPRMLLLDEPLSAVDASGRIELRRELRAHLDAFDGVRLIVAHHALDAFALADRIAVLESGRVVQTGTVAEICVRPRTSYVADLVGLNLVEGNAVAGVLRTDTGATLVVASAPDGPVLATVHPRAVALFRERPQGSPRNVWNAPVVAVETAVDRLRVQVGGALPLVAEVTAAASLDLRLAEGGDVWVALKATEVVVYAG